MWPLKTNMRTYLLLMTCLMALTAFAWPAVAVAQRSQTATKCSQAGNDDRVRPYDPSLRVGFLIAYKLLFPQSKGEPDETELKTASYRCMGGHLLACFAGANLPCAKLDASRDNKGATAFCRKNPDAPIVPVSATGHDTIYFFSCSGGRAKIKEQNWKLDGRGFGVELWKSMD
jgi:hypothetical protein